MPTQRYDQRSDDQGGDNQDHRVVFPEEANQQVLATEHQHKVQSQQACGEQAIDQGPVDNGINLPQSRAQHSKSKGKWN